MQTNSDTQNSLRATKCGDGVEGDGENRQRCKK